MVEVVEHLVQGPEFKPQYLKKKKKQPKQSPV
jgi:hypothetical protein